MNAKENKPGEHLHWRPEFGPSNEPLTFDCFIIRARNFPIGSAFKSTLDRYKKLKFRHQIKENKPLQS